MTLPPRPQCVNVPNILTFKKIFVLPAQCIYVWHCTVEQTARFAPYHLSCLFFFFGHVRKITKMDCQLRHVCLSICPSVWNNSAPTRGIFMKFGNLSRKFKCHQDLTTITGTLHEDRYIFLIISRSFLLIMRNVSDKICAENQNTHFMFNNPFIRKFCRL